MRHTTYIVYTRTSLILRVLVSVVRLPDLGGTHNRAYRDLFKYVCLTPGAGKTTLAHVAGAHAGYRVVEINASDDRSAEKLVQKVQDAMAMQSVMGDRRPNLVVLDEIDGAVGGSNESRNAIAALVKYIAKCAAERTATGSGSDGVERMALTRPLICICNDVYAPALRPLRNLAKVFRMGALRPSRLSVRLNSICSLERIAATKSALDLLCKLCMGDVRACVNTLQILRSASKGKIFRLTSAALETSTVAQRDHERSLFEHWETVFREPKSSSSKVKLHTHTDSIVLI